MALTDKQQAFINEYLKCWNATQAAIEAGYSEKTARSIGSENLTKPDIVNEIKRRIEENAMKADEALARLAKQARGSMADFIGVIDGANVPMFDWERARNNGMLDLVKELKIDEDGISFKLYDAQSALVTILRELRLDAGKPTDIHDVNVTDAKERLQYLISRQSAAESTNGDTE